MIYKHRINSLELVSMLDTDIGLEVDIRYHNKQLVVSHDPFHGLCLELEEFLRKVGNRRIIFNIKSEGLEEEVRKLCDSLDIASYTFLDCSIPYIIKGIKMGHRDYLLRVSRYESLEGFLDIRSGIAGIWLDHFDDVVASTETIKQLKSFDKPVILVSPELHGYSIDKIPQMLGFYKMHFRDFSVCTKRPDLWRGLYTA